MRSVHEDNQEARPATSDRRASAPHLTPLLCSIDCSSVPYPARPWEPPLNHSLAQQCVRAGVVTWITWIGRRRKKKKMLFLKVRLLWEPASGSLKEHII